MNAENFFLTRVDRWGIVAKWLSCVWTMLVCGAASCTCCCPSGDARRLGSYAEHYRKYGDSYFLNKTLSGLVDGSMDRKRVSALLGVGVAITDEEAGRVRKCQNDRNVFPDGVRGDDEFRGYVMQKYPRQILCVLQFREGKLLYSRGQSLFVITRFSEMTVDGKPWCLLASCDPGLGTQVPWHAAFSTNGTGFAYVSGRAYPLTLRQSEWDLLVEKVQSFQFQTLKEQHKPSVIDSGKRLLEIALNGSTRRVVVGRTATGAQYCSGGDLVAFEAVWRIIRSLKEAAVRDCARRRRLSQTKLTP